MSIYKHTQIGFVTGGGLLAATALMIIVGLTTGAWNTAILATLAGLSACAVLFATLTIKVDDRALTFYFGPRFWKKTIPVKKITGINIVRNPIWYGWGIRYTPRGWLYNVSGFRAIEIEIDGKRTIRVGTDDPESVRRAIARAKQ